MVAAWTVVDRPRRSREDSMKPKVRFARAYARYVLTTLAAVAFGTDIQ
jgi:hypothetical protein